MGKEGTGGASIKVLWELSGCSTGASQALIWHIGKIPLIQMRLASISHEACIFKIIAPLKLMVNADQVSRWNEEAMEGPGQQCWTQLRAGSHPSSSQQCLRLSQLGWGRRAGSF